MFMRCFCAVAAVPRDFVFLLSDLWYRTLGPEVSDTRVYIGVRGSQSNPEERHQTCTDCHPRPRSPPPGSKSK